MTGATPCAPVIFCAWVNCANPRPKSCGTGGRFLSHLRTTRTCGEPALEPLPLALEECGRRSLGRAGLSFRDTGRNRHVRPTCARTIDARLRLVRCEPCLTLQSGFLALLDVGRQSEETQIPPHAGRAGSIERPEFFGHLAAMLQRQFGAVRAGSLDRDQYQALAFAELPGHL